MKIYARVGESMPFTDERKNPEMPEGYIEMKTKRPGENYIAAENGEWVKVSEQENKSE